LYEIQRDTLYFTEISSPVDASLVLLAVTIIFPEVTEGVLNVSVVAVGPAST
jgi:hypothetical protein